jgi:hypothetical protein
VGEPPQRNPFENEGSRRGRRIFILGCREVAQPAKAMQFVRPSEARRLGPEWRSALAISLQKLGSAARNSCGTIKI